jgi:hypothetical protein
VASKPTSTPQYVTVCIFFVGHFKTLTNTQPHITLFAFYLLSFSYPLRGTGATVHSGGMIAEIYLEPSNFFLYGSWSADGMMEMR